MEYFVVYGGTGSLGTALIKRLLHDPEHGNVRAVISVSRSEERQRVLAENCKYVRRLYFVTGDVTDYSTVDSVRRRVQQLVQNQRYDTINFVYAAAIKQVPYAEINVTPTVRTNVIGCEHALLTATDLAIMGYNVRFVGVSTDKAVEPINVMGLTKALQESLVFNWPYLKASIVRYGNVIGTTGSVIPIMLEKAKKQQTIEIHDEEATRFLVPISDAVDAILTACIIENAIVLPRNMIAAKIARLPNLLSSIFKDRVFTHTVTKQRSGDKRHEVIVTEYEIQKVKDEQLRMLGMPMHRSSADCVADDATAISVLRKGLSDVGIPVPD